MGNADAATGEPISQPAATQFPASDFKDVVVVSEHTTDQPVGFCLNPARRNQDGVWNWYFPRPITATIRENKSKKSEKI